MAEGVVSVLLNKLCELIEKEAHLPSRVKPDVILLRQKLEWISLSVKEADEKCSEDKQIRLWVAQVRKAAFEPEDIIDEFAFQVKKNQAFRNIVKQIQKINSSLDDISKNRSELGMGNVQDKGEPSVPVIRKEKRSPRVEEANTVGIEDEVEIISKMMLIGGGARTSVVSIVGMGGLGKTTLATNLFNHIHIHMLQQVTDLPTPSPRLEKSELRGERISQRTSAACRQIDVAKSDWRRWSNICCFNHQHGRFRYYH